MERLDMNCFCGRWPFYKVRCDTLEKLRNAHSRCGIAGGLVSSLEAVFYQDPFEAETELAAAVQGTPYRQAMVLNPTLPGWQEDLARSVKELHIAAARLVPGLHGYRLTDNALLDPVCEKLQYFSLPLLISLRLEDPRCTWMLRPEPVALADIRSFVSAHPQLPTLLTCMQNAEFLELCDCFALHSRLYADTSGFSGSISSLCQSAAGDRIVYGSGAPLLEMQSATAIIQYSGIEKAMQDDLFSGRNFI